MARHHMAKFPRLREIRENLLHWEITDLASRLPHGKPSISSLYRLEQGYEIRLVNVQRVFQIVNDALDKTLDPTTEIVRI